MHWPYSDISCTDPPQTIARTALCTMFKHPFARGRDNKTLYTPASYLATGRKSLLVCTCGCDMLLTLRRSRNLPNRRYVSPHFIAAKRSTGRRQCHWGTGESQTHIIAKQLLHDNFNKIVFGGQKCAGFMCRCRRGVTFNTSSSVPFIEKSETRTAQGTVRPDVTVCALDGGQRWALEVFHTHQKSEEDVAKIKHFGMRVAEFEATHVHDKLGGLDHAQQKNVLLTNLRPPSEYEDMVPWLCDACSTTLWWQTEWREVEEAEQMLESAYFTYAQQQAQSLRKRKMESFELADKPSLSYAMSSAADRIELQQQQGAIKNQKKWIPRNLLARCVNCSAWIDKSQSLHLERYKHLFGAKWSDRFDNFICDDCATECYICSHRIPLLQVASFGRCYHCNMLLGEIRKHYHDFEEGSWTTHLRRIQQRICNHTRSQWVSQLLSA